MNTQPFYEKIINCPAKEIAAYKMVEAETAKSEFKTRTITE